MEVYGYGRVSTRDQNLDRQLEAFGKIPIKEKNIYVDKQSGATFEREAYQVLCQNLKKDDLLYIHSIDRLGRNYKEILEQWKILTKEIGIDIVVIDMPILDTRYAKDLLGTFLSDVILQVLSFVAENERTNTKIRQAEGIAIAKKKGTQFGRRPKMDSSEFVKKYRMYYEQGLTESEMIEKMGISTTTFYRYKKKKIII